MLLCFIELVFVSWLCYRAPPAVGLWGNGECWLHFQWAAWQNPLCQAWAHPPWLAPENLPISHISTRTHMQKIKPHTDLCSVIWTTVRKTSEYARRRSNPVKQLQFSGVCLFRRFKFSFGTFALLAPGRFAFAGTSGGWALWFVLLASGCCGQGPSRLTI